MAYIKGLPLETADMRSISPVDLIHKRANIFSMQDLSGDLIADRKG